MKTKAAIVQRYKQVDGRASPFDSKNRGQVRERTPSELEELDKLCINNRYKLHYACEQVRVYL